MTDTTRRTDTKPTPHRFTPTETGSMVLSEQGEWVPYVDFLRLTAEVALLKELIDVQREVNQIKALMERYESNMATQHDWPDPSCPRMLEDEDDQAAATILQEEWERHLYEAVTDGGRDE